MLSIAVTGSAGALGKRVVEELLGDPEVYRVVAIDRRLQRATDDKMTVTRLAISESSEQGANADLVTALTGCDSVIHAASDEGRATSHRQSSQMLERLLDAATEARVGHIVIISSAMVYGGLPDNAVPLAEDAPLRATDDLAFVAAKLEMERLATTWASSGHRAAILRPTTTLAEGRTSWIARTLKMATTVRTDRVDPPVQFIHYEDLASAAACVAVTQASGAFNVSPDGFISSEGFHQLVGGLQLRLPATLPICGYERVVVSVSAPHRKESNPTYTTRGWWQTTGCDRSAGRPDSPTKKHLWSEHRRPRGSFRTNVAKRSC